MKLALFNEPLDASFNFISYSAHCLEPFPFGSGRVGVGGES
jgi:hypothetical protein